MLKKKRFIYIIVILSYTPFIAGNDLIDSAKIVNFPASESKKVFTKQEVNNDIERVLLRPVKLEKEIRTIYNQESVDPLSKLETEENIEEITSILSAEKKKLNELENEYKKIEKELIEKTDTKTPASLSNEKLTSIRKSDDGTAFILSKKDIISRVGSSTEQQGIAKDRKQEIDISEDLNRRLSKVIGNGRLLDLAESFYKLCEYNNALQTYKLITPSDVSSDQYMWAQYQIANCYRNMKEFDQAINEYQHFIDQYPTGDLIEPAKWYIDDANWWKSWYKKNTLTSSHKPEQMR
ncbi:MAG: hypothetical protein HBSAPP01_14290 [Candidatus Brocadia sapporoensis]|nr:tetratricopeptide repeat protein [Candidatus Brocadia sp.]GJQ23639.1 MAG: hypothetical protein HBSAPP01_14290 [Candidatus Brocadia sapporoensis]